MSFEVLMMIAFGLLQPLTVLRPRIRKDWLLYTLFIPLCALVASTLVPERDAVAERYHLRRRVRGLRLASHSSWAIWWPPSAA